MPKLKQRDNSKASRVIKLRITLLAALLGVGTFIALIIQLYSIQIIQHDFYEEQAIRQQTSGITVAADRGSILDRNYKTLAISAHVETVYLEPVYIKTEEQAALIATGLSEILGVDYDYVYERTQRNSRYERIKRKVEQDEAQAVRDFKLAHKDDFGGLPAIKLEPDTKRYYSFSTFASQVIGFVGADNYGLEGLENFYDEVLTGVAGKKVTAKNAAGTQMSFQYEKLYDAVDGQTVVLTIDETIQHIIEKHLEQAVIDDDIQNRGAAIVMQVDTGEILAMATTDGADLNNYSALTDADRAQLVGLEGDAYNAKYMEILQKRWRNKAVADTYDPGSVFKLITLSMALEERTVSMESSFTCTGAATVKGWGHPISCWRKQGHGTQTLTRALQNSCNPAFINIGLSVPASRFYDYLLAYGFGQYTGVDMPGEASGLLLSHDFFVEHPESHAVYSFGQTFTVTPLQMITAVSAVVNGGNLMKPHIVREVLNADGSVAETVEPELVRQVISKETSELMCHLMEQVVVDGSGRNAQVQGYRIGGKTATSEKTGEADSQGRYVVSFVAVAPADNPEIALLVLLDEPGERIPQSQRSGGWLAAPLAGSIMKDILPVLGYEPTFTGDEMFGANVTVPNVSGLSVADAMASLDKKSLDCRVVGEGASVVGQIPSAGSEVTTSATVILYTENEAPSDMVTVPNVTGKSPEQANKAITDAGLFLRPSGALSKATGTISAVSQSIDAGSEVPRGTVVEVGFLDSNVGDYARSGVQ